MIHDDIFSSISHFLHCFISSENDILLPIIVSSFSRIPRHIIFQIGTDGSLLYFFGDLATIIVKIAAFELLPLCIIPLSFYCQVDYSLIEAVSHYSWTTQNESLSATASKSIYQYNIPFVPFYVSSSINHVWLKLFTI